MGPQTTCPDCGREIDAQAAPPGQPVWCAGCGRMIDLPVETDAGRLGPMVRTAMLLGGFVAGGFVTGPGRWPMAYVCMRTEIGAIVALCLTCMALLAVIAWVTRLTVWSCMVWVALSAVYLHVTISAVRAQSAVASVVYFATFGALGLVLYLLAKVRFRRGRLSPAHRARYAARALAALFIGSLLAALMPPVSLAREASRRTQCRGNLHQIGLALHNYHDRYGCFPPAVTTDGPGQPMHSWTVYLLPYLAEPDLYCAYNFRHAHDAPANTTVAATRLHVFTCPAADTSGNPMTSYGMVVCPGSIGGVDRWPRIRDIRDGTSGTIMVVEMSRTACPWTSPAAVVNLMRGINVPPSLPQGGSSDHPGGAFALFADAQVRFLRDEMDMATLRKLCTMAGNEVVEDEEY